MTNSIKPPDVRPLSAPQIQILVSCKLPQRFVLKEDGKDRLTLFLRDQDFPHYPIRLGCLWRHQDDHSVSPVYPGPNLLPPVIIPLKMLVKPVLNTCSA